MRFLTRYGILEHDLCRPRRLRFRSHRLPAGVHRKLHQAICNSMVSICRDVLRARTHSHYARPTVIVGLFMQQAIALFVLKSGAGFSIFNWIATLASDFLNQGLVGAQFFFDAEIINRHWFFVNTVGAATLVALVCDIQLL